ncbi:hypothetical protein [Sorangium sp. So ce1078]|uniref:hypothetical protein n=1 Tax=Sorangium sp. So ce1078 TaxID=3133329 RepID=UPI003F60C6C0
MAGRVESLRFDFGAGGELHLFGREMLREGVELNAAGLIRMPSEGPSPDTWFHDAGGSTAIRDEAGYRFSMASLVRLGACPGEPIAGEIVYESEADVLSGRSREHRTATARVPASSRMARMRMRAMFISILVECSMSRSTGTRSSAVIS